MFLPAFRTARDLYPHLYAAASEGRGLLGDTADGLPARSSRTPPRRRGRQRDPSARDTRHRRGAGRHRCGDGPRAAAPPATRERTHHHARKRPRRGQNPHATGDFERAGDADDARHLRRSQPGGNRLPAHAGVRERAQARGRPAPRGLPPDPGRGRPRRSGLRRADEVRGLRLHGRRSRAL